MEIQFLGTSAGQPSKSRNVSCTALKLLDELNEVWLFDVGEATQHQILKTNIRPRKVTRIFISHTHGDHIFGLPGFLSSRSFQGDGGPLTIYGPAGIEQFVQTSLRVSKTRVSYPIKYVVLKEDGLIFENDIFAVYTARLDHRVPSFGFRVVEKPRPGELLMDKVAEYNVPNGPLLGELKAGKTITLSDGQKLDGRDFLGEERPGRIVTIIYDTRPTKNIGELADNADVLVHESTFDGGEEKMAHRYFHSTCLDAARVARDHNVGELYLTHISARYTGRAGRQLEHDARKIFKHTHLANDLDNFEITLRG
ncbi:ribonuclease Z [Lactobacillus johnsonii]|uniref:Ribonuclease Z n=1 Tax=Lactobacillus johnsonii TaxID=33959 RepID=A0A9X7Y6B2_LACJH|nr:ribonuclease Z [Lactobacillus johnsonii]QLL68310.1 ribonuclease Z [Lactobacillus johnsonii]